MSIEKKRVAIIGTNGIPSNYGGYETLVEYLTKYLSKKFDFIVYCSKDQPTRIKEHNGAKLVYFPLKANGWQSIIYDIITLMHASFKTDTIFYLGLGAGFMVPILRIFKKKIIVNHGGLNEWERTKFNIIQRLILKMGHSIGGKYASLNIADNFQLRDSLAKNFGIDSTTIRYGGDHAKPVEVNDDLRKKYPFLNYNYYINVSRAQIDNNLHLVLDAFKANPEKNLVLISNWSVSSYGINLKKEFSSKYSNIILLDAIYNSKVINAIRSNAIAYIHSHSYCGTSPSLVEAMSLGLPVISFDVPTNRETTQNKAIYFSSMHELIKLLYEIKPEKLLKCGYDMKRIAEEEYTWDKISSLYADLFSS